MKIGKLPEPVLIRSVLKQVKHRREEVLVGPAVGQDCAALEVGEDEVLVMSTDPITGTAKDLGHHSIHITANDLAAAGADPVGVMLTVMLPDTVEEPEIRKMMQDAEETCEKLHMEILGGHTEITNVVKQPLISVTGVGKMKKENLRTVSQIRPDQDIIVTKWIGLEATTILAKEKEDELKKRFPAVLIDTQKILTSICPWYRSHGSPWNMVYPLCMISPRAVSSVRSGRWRAEPVSVWKWI